MSKHSSDHYVPFLSRSLVASRHRCVIMHEVMHTRTDKRAGGWIDHCVKHVTINRMWYCCWRDSKIFATLLIFNWKKAQKKGATIIIMELKGAYKRDSNPSFSLKGEGGIGVCQSADSCLFFAKSVDPPIFLFKSETAITSWKVNVNAIVTSDFVQIVKKATCSENSPPSLSVYDKYIFYLLDGIYIISWYGNRFFFLSSHLKTWNFPSSWVRNRRGLGPETSEAVNSKLERRTRYILYASYALLPNS